VRLAANEGWFNRAYAVARFVMQRHVAHGCGLWHQYTTDSERKSLARGRL
jgi:hypothetical protein